MNVLAKSNRIRKTGARASTLAALVLLLVTCLGVSGFSIQVAQPTKADGDLRQFVGTWQTRFKGKIFQTLKLEIKQGNLTGTVSHANVGVDRRAGYCRSLNRYTGLSASLHHLFAFLGVNEFYGDVTKTSY